MDFQQATLVVEMIEIESNDLEQVNQEKNKGWKLKPATQHISLKCKLGETWTFFCCSKPVNPNQKERVPQIPGSLSQGPRAKWGKMLEALGIDSKKLQEAQQDIVREDVILSRTQIFLIWKTKTNMSVASHDN